MSTPDPTATAADWTRPLWPFVRVECWRCGGRGWRFNWVSIWPWCRACGFRVLPLRDVDEYRRTHAD